MAKNSAYQAGILDRVITVSVLDALKNSQGEHIGFSPTPLLVLAAAVEESKAVETTEETRLTAFNRLDFVVRHNTEIKPDMRITYEGAEYDILGIVQIPEPRRMWTRLHCQTRD